MFRTKSVPLCIVFVLVAIGLASAIFLQVLRANARATLVFIEPRVDLGTHAKGAILPCDLAFKNVSTHAIQIGSVEAGCSCAEARFPHEEIMPGQSGTISLRISVDRIGAYRLQPRVRIVGSKEPIWADVHVRGVQVLEPDPPVVYLDDLTKDHTDEISFRWAVNAKDLARPLGRWYVDTPADFLWLGEPRVTSDGESTYVVVRGTLLGFAAPQGLFRTRVTLSNLSIEEIASDCLVVGTAQDDGLLFDPPSVLLGRVQRVPGIVQRNVKVRLRSRRPLQIAKLQTSDAALNAQLGGHGIAAEIVLSVHLAKLPRAGRWSADLVVSSVSGVKQNLRLYAFVQADESRESPSSN